jgi:hypothetical protein
VRDLGVWVWYSALVNRWRGLLMEIHFEGLYDRKDILRALKLHFNPSRIIVYFRIALMGVVILAYILYLLFSGPVVYKDQPGIILPALIILYVIAIPFLRPYEAVSKFLKAPEAHKPISGSASELGIVWKTFLVTSDYKWEVFKRLIVTDNFSMFYQGDTDWYILIPLNFFQTQSDWNRFRSLARSKIPNNKIV